MRSIAALAALCAFAGPALADQTTIPLRYIAPSKLVSLISAPGGPGAGKGLLPEGLTRVDPDDEKNEVTVHGSAEALGKFRELVRFLDVRAKMVRVEAVLRKGDTTVMRPVLLVSNNQPATVQVGENVLALVVHVNGDNTLSVFILPETTGAASRADGPGKPIMPVPVGTERAIARRVKQNEATTVPLQGGRTLILTARVVEEASLGSR